MSPLDKQLGIEVYVTKSLGVGGVIREEVEDFVVEEVLVDGSKANVNGAVPAKFWVPLFSGRGFCCAFWLSATGTLL